MPDRVPSSDPDRDPADEPGPISRTELGRGRAPEHPAEPPVEPVAPPSRRRVVGPWQKDVPTPRERGDERPSPPVVGAAGVVGGAATTGPDPATDGRGPAGDGFGPVGDGNTTDDTTVLPRRGESRHAAAPRERLRRKRRSNSKGSFWKELPILIVTALVLTFLIQTFLARVYVIPSASMEKTLHGCSGCSNDRVLVDKMIYRFGDPSPGDVVVFRGPDSWGKNQEFDSDKSDNFFIRGLQEAAALVGLAPPDERDFVKRVIATEGQTVQCCDPNNRLLVNGAPLDEPYLFLQDDRPQEAFGPITVPDNRLWVMGDNRNNSADSRRHVSDEHTGTISEDDVIGKARAIVLPPGRWGGIGDHDPQNSALGLSVGPADAAPLGAGLVLAVPIWWVFRRNRGREEPGVVDDAASDDDQAGPRS